MSDSAYAPTPEIGGIVHLDHVNFEIGDQDLATMFFVNGLGLTRDPYQRADETNMGINVGMEQFHLPRRAPKTPTFHGEIGLVVPDLAAIAVRLERLEGLGAFEGTAYLCEMGNRTALVTSPYGFVLRLHEAGTLACQRPLGLAYVEVAVPPERSAAIGRFYADMFDAPVSAVEHDGCGAIEIAAGPYQVLRFVERDLDDHATHSMHISYYTTRYNAARERLTRIDPSIGSRRRDVFFFRKITDPDGGDTVFTINNEVRSLYHPDFRRQLANRWPIIEEPFADQSEVMAALIEAGIRPGQRT